MEAEIALGQRDAREKPLDNFDQEVLEKVRIESHEILDRFNEQLWRLTRHLLAEHAHFDTPGYSFMLHTNPFPDETIHPGPYRLGKRVEDANTCCVGHPLAQRVLQRGKALAPLSAEVTFQYTEGGKHIAVLESLVGRRGWLARAQLTLDALETEDRLVLSGLTDDGEHLDEAQCRRLFDLPAIQGPCYDIPVSTAAVLDNAQAGRRQMLLDEITARNGRWFDIEMDKLDRWAEDRRASLKAELAELDDALKEAKKAARLAPTLLDKLDRQRAVRTLEAKREDAWRTYDQASREIDRQKDALLDEISRRLEQRIEHEPLFVLRWHLL
jgi:hypothetical protein